MLFARFLHFRTVFVFTAFRFNGRRISKDTGSNRQQAKRLNAPLQMFFFSPAIVKLQYKNISIRSWASSTVEFYVLGQKDVVCSFRDVYFPFSRLSLLHGFASETRLVCSDCKFYWLWTYWAQYYILIILEKVHIVDTISSSQLHCIMPSKLRHHLQGRGVPQVQVMQRKPRNPPCSSMDHGCSAMGLSPHQLIRWQVKR